MAGHSQGHGTSSIRGYWMIRGEVPKDRTRCICVEAQPGHLVRVSSSKCLLCGYVLLKWFTVDAVAQDSARFMWYARGRIQE